MLNQGSFLKAYEIRSVIGHGGFGVVYKGTHRELGIEVAIKEYFPSELCVRRHDQSVYPSKPEFQASFEESLGRFISEAKQLEKFRDCSNVVTCRDLFRTNGTAYIIMDYVHGLPLSALLERREARGEPFTEQDLLQVTLPLLRGLQTVHESGVCHRDIKPSNILIRSTDRTPVLIDFGAAKYEVSRHTKSAAPYSDGYAAMEQIGEGEIGPWTDMYGVGAVMWRMVAGGAPPFSPPNPLPIQQRALKLMQGHQDPLPSAKNIGRGRFSDSVLKSIDNCLTVNPDKRVKDCNVLLTKLPNYSGGTAPSVVPNQVTVKLDSVQTDIQLKNEPIYQSKNKANRLNLLFMLIGGVLVLLGVIEVANLAHDLAKTNWGDSEIIGIITSIIGFALPTSSIGLLILTLAIPTLRKRWYYHHYNEQRHLNGKRKRSSRVWLRENMKRITLLLLALTGIYVFLIGIFIIIFESIYYAVRPSWLIFMDDVQSDIIGASILVPLSIAIGLLIFRLASLNLKKL